MPISNTSCINGESVGGMVLSPLKLEDDALLGVASAQQRVDRPAVAGIRHHEVHAPRDPGRGRGVGIEPKIPHGLRLVQDVWHSVHLLHRFLVPMRFETQSNERASADTRSWDALMQ